LSIYQRLAELDDNPNWRGSTVYQIGLCFERLRHLERAREAYQYILDKIPVTTNTTDTDAIIGINLSTLREMAQWRINNLSWLEKTEKDVALLLDKQPPTPIGKSASSNSTAAPAGTPIQTAQSGKTPFPKAQNPVKAQKSN
jgi:hypothetical protein